MKKVIFFSFFISEVVCLSFSDIYFMQNKASTYKKRLASFYFSQSNESYLWSCPDAHRHCSAKTNIYIKFLISNDV